MKQNDSSIDRGSKEDQDRWLAELEAAEAADDFPSGGSVILAESSTHALKVAKELKAQGHRTIVCGVYVRTTAEMRRKSEPSPSERGRPSTPQTRAETPASRDMCRLPGCRR